MYELRDTIAFLKYDWKAQLLVQLDRDLERAVEQDEK
jgi:hypothetical protein